MNAKPENGASDWTDPDDPPELDEDFFDRAEIRLGDKVLRPGRPRSDKPKVQVTLRLDQDVLEHFRGGGDGWQTRINRALRSAMSGK